MQSMPDNINAGLYTYPVLMAGGYSALSGGSGSRRKRQKQHVEITRDIAARFNNAYGETFKLPEPYIPKVGGRSNEPYRSGKENEQIGH